jgi:hypothetical protein
MARLIVAIEIPNTSASKLKQDIESDRNLKDTWFSPEDGDKILVDGAYLGVSLVDNSFFVFEFIGVKD